MNYVFLSHIHRWGCSHEEHAKKAYNNLMLNSHEDFTVSTAGFFIDCETPFLGASPDAIVDCKCCGRGTLEVKCPYCYKDGIPEDDVGFYMFKKDDAWTLKRDHQYYYQIQLQMYVCHALYADFVVWTEGNTDPLIERIAVDYQFVTSKLADVKYFFMYGILPEIVGKWYSRKPVAETDGTVSLPFSTDKNEVESDEGDDTSRLWCYCNQPSYGNMIMCDNKACTIKWFHFDCLRIRSPAKGKWYCPSCRKLPKFNKNKK